MSKEIKEIQRAVDELLMGNVLLYPTDTVWGIGCDAENAEAVKKVFQVKARPADKPFILLVSNLEMLQRYVKNLPPNFESQLQNQERPTTYIFPEPQNLPAEVLANDGSAAIRIPQDEFCHRLVQQFGRAIVSTSANISGEPTSGSFKDIPESLKNKVDYVVTWRQEEEINAKPSRIVAIQPDGSLKIIRD